MKSHFSGLHVVRLKIAHKVFRTKMRSKMMKTFTLAGKFTFSLSRGKRIFSLSVEDYFALHRDIIIIDFVRYFFINSDNLFIVKLGILIPATLQFFH